MTLLLPAWTSVCGRETSGLAAEICAPPSMQAAKYHSTLVINSRLNLNNDQDINYGPLESYFPFVATRVYVCLPVLFSACI